MRVGAVLGQPAVLRSLSTGSPAGHLLTEVEDGSPINQYVAEGSMYSQAHIRLSKAGYPKGEVEVPVQTLLSVAPCDQGQTEKVSLGSLEVLYLVNRWRSVRVPPAAAPSGFTPGRLKEPRG